MSGSPKQTENWQRALRGELYHAFTPDLVAARRRCGTATGQYNRAEDEPRRRQVELWRKIVGDDTPLPPRKEGASEEEDEALFDDDPWVTPPFNADYGVNLKLGKNVYINRNCIVLDTCLVTIGDRVLMGPNVSFYSATHPTDPDLRNGTRGPELGKEIHIGNDVWIGGNVVFCPGVTVGQGSSIGAGSVVTRDIPEYSIAVGNPARVKGQAPRNSTTAEERQHILDIANRPS